MQEWQPILEGETRERALETVWAIADELVPGRDPSLAAGNAGLAVLYAYLAAARDGAGYREMAVACLGRAAAASDGQAPNPALFAGTSGIAWAAAHLGLCGELNSAGDPCNAADRAVLAGLSHADWNGEYGLVDGLLGYGIYAIERLPRAAAVLSLEKLVDRLSGLAEWDSRGASWATREPRAAQGVPGVIAMLAAVIQVGLAVHKARPLLEGAVGWLRAHPPEDPGAAAALLLAARMVGEATWEREALAMARRGACSLRQAAGVAAPRLAHRFNRLYQATGDPELLGAARFWLDQTLAIRRPELPLMGYPAEGGIVSGAAGVALTLLAACTDCEPAWDRIFLISPPK